MKKAASFILMLSFLLCSLFAFTGCDNELNVSGTYEFESTVSGSNEALKWEKIIVSITSKKVQFIDGNSNWIYTLESVKKNEYRAVHEEPSAAVLVLIFVEVDGGLQLECNRGIYKHTGGDTTFI